jgi:hypothetical protein
MMRLLTVYCGGRAATIPIRILRSDCVPSAASLPHHAEYQPLYCGILINSPSLRADW